MSGRNEIRTRTFRWRELIVTDAGVSNMTVIEEVATILGDKRLEFCKVESIGPQAVAVAYSPSFNDAVRLILLNAIRKKWPRAHVNFYGEEVVTVLRSAVCLDEYIQGD